ncbi:ClpP/crotonase-like domain-containing protein [Pisolithus orientalis]|uniref:ClpP/crotonase-like domain-containing protein n=1 Tax=Pisolithus orientalis TaxID=936130 RepID=UPI002224D4AF|nr:ClpP/crotonase-like domain-containing protein [Pisolithus orientalis]KAI6028359.1 ClpP/crotonase-like domain-containing protein [Pisolithus orientalis]
MGQSKIAVEVLHGIATITLNEPQRLNALSPEDYDDFANSLREIDQRNDVVVTTLASGTNVKAGVAASQPTEPTLRGQLRALVISANTDCTHAVRACKCLSKAFLGNFDFIYAVPEAWLSMGLPFVGLAVEGGASVNFVNRMGLAKANEALIFNKKMTAQELLECGFINKIFPSKSTETFHLAVRQYLHSELKGLDPASILAEKNNPDALNLRESYAQAERFRSGVPSIRFGMLARKEIRHKL